MNQMLTERVKQVLYKISGETKDIFSEKALEIIEKEHRSLKASSRHIKIELIEPLLSQLPDVPITKVHQLLEYVKAARKRNIELSVSYSPLVIDYKEFKPCKLMKFNNGDIITQRDREIEAILLTLCRKRKRGVILIGEAGTGKTAVVNAINNKLIQRTVPRQLIGCQVLNMDIPYILSKNKEDPIAAIVKILEKACEYDKVILFIDEIHQLLNNRMNDILKPYLTEQIRFIGSTTSDEYHNIVNEDKALERRFTVVLINEPSIQTTIEMVKGTKITFEEHHKCTIPDDVCSYLVENGSRFLGNRRNPDKSLDILDMSCSIMYESEIKSIYDKEDVKIGSNIREIASLRDVTGNRILNKHYVDMAIAKLTGIRYEEIKNSLDQEYIISAMKEAIVGQDKSIEQVSNIVNIFKVSKCDRTRPISKMLFIGPEGCGKKTTGEALAQYLYGDKNHFIYMDMSGFKNSFMITELKGSPPGYIGYGKSGGLIKLIKNNPLSIVYLSKINEADKEIVQYLLSASKSGIMKDSAEREAYLNNCVVIFAVTLKDKDFDNLAKAKGSMGFAKEDDKKVDINEKLEDLIGPDIVSCVDNIILFDKLTKPSLEHIFDKKSADILSGYNVSIDINEIRKKVLETAKNGHEIISQVESEIPKLMFKKINSKE